MANSEFTFRITQKEAAEQYSVTATAGTVLDEELCKKYSESAIIKAKQLKAKHGEKYSDEYYLDYGKSLVLQGIIGANKEIHKNRLNGCAITDMEWAVYSYEEILEMEASGYKIPEDILQWAHSQQEADVTDYVMVSDTTAAEDSTTDASTAGKNELGNLKKKAQQHITKSEKALEEATQSIEQYNEIAAKAKKIKDEREDKYKDAMNQISSKTQEWKELDEKKKTGKLTKLEEKRYKKLSKELNGSDNSVMKQIKIEHSDLDNFLSTLDELNIDISDNLTLARNTIKAGKDLGEYEKNYHSAQLPMATDGIIIDGNGKDLDSLYEVKSNEEIAEVAIDKGTELDSVANNLAAEVTNDENTQLALFATEFSELATKTEEETKNVIGEQSNEENNKEDKNKPANYNVSMNFTSVNAALATATTLVSTADLLTRDKNVDKNDKELKKELTKAQKDSAELSKESTTAEAKLETNQTKTDETLTKLEATKTEPSENNNEKDALISQLAQNQDEGKSLKTLVKKATVKSASSTSKGEKLTKTLTERNANLGTRNENAKSVAEKTQKVGAGTMARGFIDTALGMALQSTGATLMSNPFTFANGVALVILGTEFQTRGEKEVIFGTVAMGTGTIGLTATSTAADTNKNADATIKNANQVFKTNNEEIKNASEVSVDGEENTQTETQGEEAPAEETPSTTEETSTEATTTEEQPQENENPEVSAQQNQQKKSNEPSVDIQFSTQNAISATATSIKATADMVGDERDMSKLTRIVRNETKRSETLIKNIDSETAKAVTAHQANMNESETIAAQQSAAQSEAQNAQTTEQATAAQNKMANLSTQLSATSDKDEQITSSADKTVSNSVQQLAKFRNNTQIMNKDLAALDKTIANQHEIATKTMGVGIGTTALGILNSNQGTGMMISGLTLMSNPFTYGMGVAQVIAGEILLTKGLAEVASGGVATTTGTMGIVTNAITNAVSKDSDAVLKEANAQNNELEKKAGESSKELAEESNSNVDTANSEPEIANNQQETPEENEFLSSLTELSASASANANVVETALTDDKADRKLSRFNTESIIESKKKMKKVQGVFATSGGKA